MYNTTGPHPYTWLESIEGDKPISGTPTNHRSFLHSEPSAEPPNPPNRPNLLTNSQGGAALAALAVVDRTAPGGVSYYDGAHSYDEICCALGKSYTDVDSDVRSDPHCVVLSR